MNVLYIYAGFAVVIGLALLWWRRSEGKQLALMAATPTSKAEDVATLAPGSMVEVKGVLRCAAPLAAEFSQRACAYFKAEIYERRITHTTDSDGKKRESTGSHAIQSNCRSAPCVVEDDSGRVVLALDDVTLEGETTVDRIERPGGELTESVVLIAGADRIEYHHIENILPYDIPVYVLGEVQADRSVGKPAKGSKNKTFLVSVKSEEERSASATSTMYWLMVIAGVLFALAAVLVVWARVEGA